MTGSESYLAFVIQGGALVLLAVSMFWQRESDRRKDIVLATKDAAVGKLVENILAIMASKIRCEERLTTALRERKCLAGDSRTDMTEGAEQ
jgi:hypothetical protein